MRKYGVPVAALVGWALVLIGAARGGVAQTTRVSVVSFSGTQGNNKSDFSCSSADGRFVAFQSLASNLVLGDTNARPDVFVHDNETAVTTRISLSSLGVQGNDISGYPSISADGRFVTFESYASNLVPGDINGFADVFIRDRHLGVTTIVSVSTSGALGNSHSLNIESSISADGRFVAFWSSASNLVSGDTNNLPDVFVHDRQSGATTLVSISSSGAHGNNDSRNPSISADGRFVAFESSSSNLVADDTNDKTDTYVHDRQTGATTRVSVSTAGTQGNGRSDSSSISANGHFVAFQSDASNLVVGDTNFSRDIFVHDRQTGTTTLTSAFPSGTPLLAPQGLNPLRTTLLVSDSPSETQQQFSSHHPSISADGRFVAFWSISTNGPVGDNTFANVFVRDRHNEVTMQASVSSSATQGNGPSFEPAISADGRFVAFTSLATNLVPEDTNGFEDVFLHNLAAPASCPADANGDGVVDFLDLNIVLSDFGRSGAPGTIAGDLDGDGVVDFLDLNIVLSNFGLVC